MGGSAHLVMVHLFHGSVTLHSEMSCIAILLLDDKVDEGIELGFENYFRCCFKHWFQIRRNCCIGIHVASVTGRVQKNNALENVPLCARRYQTATHNHAKKLMKP